MIDDAARLCQTREEEDKHKVQHAMKQACKNEHCHKRKKEKRSSHDHQKEPCPPTSVDNPADSHPTSEEEDETKEECALKKVAIAKQRAQEQAARDTKIKQMKPRQDAREACAQKLKPVRAKAREALTPTLGFKNQRKMPPPTEDTLDHPTEEETALEAEAQDKKLAAKQETEADAERLVQEEKDDVQSDPEHQF